MYALYHELSVHEHTNSDDATVKPKVAMEPETQLSDSGRGRTHAVKFRSNFGLGLSIFKAKIFLHFSTFEVK